jgi:hypothetical protein
MRVAMIFMSASLGCALSAGPVLAQPAQTPAGEPPAAAATSAAGKLVECRRQARDQKLRGDARRDFMQVCRLEARLACLRQAIDKKVAGGARKEYIRTCMR